MSKKPVVQRDYNQYKQRSVQNVKVRTEKPLMNVIVFLCALAVVICMFFPSVKAYVWSDFFSIPMSNGYTYGITTYNILGYVFNNTGSVNVSEIGSLDDVIDNDLIFGLLNDEGGEFKAMLKKIIVMGILGTVLLALAVALFILSMCGVVGAKKTELPVKIISVIMLALSIAWLISATQVYLSKALLAEIVSIVVKFSFGTAIVTFFCAGATAAAFLVKK